MFANNTPSVTIPNIIDVQKSLPMPAVQQVVSPLATVVAPTFTEIAKPSNFDKFKCMLLSKNGLYIAGGVLGVTLVVLAGIWAKKKFYTQPQPKNTFGNPTKFEKKTNETLVDLEKKEKNVKEEEILPSKKEEILDLLTDSSKNVGEEVTKTILPPAPNALLKNKIDETEKELAELQKKEKEGLRKEIEDKKNCLQQLVNKQEQFKKDESSLKYAKKMQPEIDALRDSIHRRRVEVGDAKRNTFENIAFIIEKAPSFLGKIPGLGRFLTPQEETIINE